jgi:hypothetical protein
MESEHRDALCCTEVRGFGCGRMLTRIGFKVRKRIINGNEEEIFYTTS